MMYMSYDVLVLNSYRSSSWHEMTMHVFGQISMWKETLHRLGEQYQLVESVYCSLRRASSSS
jgi:hypothetical protein